MSTTAQRYIDLVKMSHDHSKSPDIRDQADEMIERLESEASMIKRDDVRYIEFADCSVVTDDDYDAMTAHDDATDADRHVASVRAMGREIDRDQRAERARYQAGK